MRKRLPELHCISLLLQLFFELYVSTLETQATNLKMPNLHSILGYHETVVDPKHARAAQPFLPIG